MIASGIEIPEGTVVMAGCAGGTDPVSRPPVASLAQGLTMFQTSAATVSGAYVKGDRAIFFETRRGPETPDAYQQIAGAPKYEMDVRVLDENGRAVYLQSGGDEYVDPTWQRDLELDLYGRSNQDSAGLQRLIPTQPPFLTVDLGGGIEDGLLPRLFKAFEQGQMSITRQFGGLGLGLAISKALVDLHGGTIEAQSDGRGLELGGSCSNGDLGDCDDFSSDCRCVAMRGRERRRWTRPTPSPSTTSRSSR